MATDNKAGSTERYGKSDGGSAASRPQVRCTPGIYITPEQTELLYQAFPNEKVILVKEEFRSGYSGALVILVSVGAGRAPLVIKFAHPHDLQQEYGAYVEFVRQVSPQNIAHLQGEPLVSEDGKLGLIQYTFAGGESHLPTNSLKAYYESNGAEETSAVLNRIFRVYGRHWWANNRAESYVLDEYYDRLLPVHLQAKPANPDVAADLSIRAGESSVLIAEQANIGQVIHIVGAEVTKSRQDGRILTLKANPPESEASAPLRIRVESAQPTAYSPGDIIESMMVEVTATRQTLLGDSAKSILPGFDPSAPQFTVPAGAGSMVDGSGIVLPNPLIKLQDQLYNVVETKMSIIHGDLNLQNILVDAPTGFSWLIDFAETRFGPTLLDLQRLEVQVITKLMPGHGDIPLAALAEMMTRLHADPPLPAPPAAALQEPFTLLVTIRRLARQYLIDDMDWNEYYYGLVVALIGALKYDELDNTARQLALVCAASADSLIGKPLHTSVPADITETQLLVAAAAADEDSAPEHDAAPPVAPIPTATSQPKRPPVAPPPAKRATATAPASAAPAPAPVPAKSGRGMAGIVMAVVAVLLVGAAAFWFASQRSPATDAELAQVDANAAQTETEDAARNEQETADDSAATVQAQENSGGNGSDGPDTGAAGVAGADDETPTAETESAAAAEETLAPAVTATGSAADDATEQATAEATAETTEEPTAEPAEATETATTAPTSTPDATPSPTSTTAGNTPEAADELAAAATATPAATGGPGAIVAPSAASLQSIFTINVRSGPGTQYDTLGALELGQSASIIGRAEVDGDDWYQIEYPPNSGKEAWISGNPSLVNVRDADDVALIAGSELPTPPPTQEAPVRVSQPAAVAGLSGDIYYSATSTSGRDNVYRVSAGGGAAALVVADAQQPAISPTGDWLAFRNVNNSSLGVSAVHLSSSRTTRHSSAPEDMLPSWNPNGDRIVYASNREGDRDYRLYLTGADGDLVRGTDPDWHPSQGMIVYRGCDSTGASCGLWTMSTSGGDKKQLTSISSDSRPRWAPDGQTVVFMSRERDANWEIYSVDVNSGRVQRLTENAANDGHPAVSPDGRSIAFISNRGVRGAWEIHVMSISGGDTQTVITLDADLPDWLAQGLDWQ